MPSYMKFIILALVAIASAQVTEITDGQPQAPTTLATKTTAAPVSEFTDGQPQVTKTASVAPVSEFTDGQPQVTKTASGAPVSEFTDGQPQATTIAPVSEFTDGQPQVTIVSNVTASPTLTPFKGAAAGNSANQIVVGMAVGIAAALMI